MHERVRKVCWEYAEREPEVTVGQSAKTTGGFALRRRVILPALPKRHYLAASTGCRKTQDEAHESFAMWHGASVAGTVLQPS